MAGGGAPVPSTRRPSTVGTAAASHTADTVACAASAASATATASAAAATAVPHYPRAAGAHGHDRKRRGGGRSGEQGVGERGKRGAAVMGRRARGAEAGGGETRTRSTSDGRERGCGRGVRSVASFAASPLAQGAGRDGGGAAIDARRGRPAAGRPDHAARRGSAALASARHGAALGREWAAGRGGIVAACRPCPAARCVVVLGDRNQVAVGRPWPRMYSILAGKRPWP